MIGGASTACWIGFHVLVAVVIACDLIVLNRHPARARTRSNLVFVLILVALAAGFAVWLARVQGPQRGLEFASSYLIELSLSIDNLFVFLVMFRSFALSPEQQHKALLLGVAGAIVMRALFIFGGIGLLERFSWIQYIFGALLLIAGARLLRGKKKDSAREEWHERWPGKWISPLTHRWGGTSARVLLVAVISIEIVDLVFALDSIPAVLAITREPFVAYTSNIFAVLGLRSLYFLLADLLDRLRFLHFGLAAILGFVGCKMILTDWFHVSIVVSLGVILGVMAIATAASLLYPAQEAPWPAERP